MYLDHYGLREPPFSITPDPRFVFLSERHRDALAHLIYGISQGGGGGFVQLTGEVGTGKTTLSRLLLEQLPARTRVALLLNPLLTPVEMLEAIAEELQLDIADARGSGKALVDRLNDHLLATHSRDERVVLIIDEAQQLSVDALEQVRLLTNLETATQKLLQIILLGQPELRDNLARPELRQLAQRITARYHLTPLNAEETAAYVGHRLAVAGLDRSPFTADAVRSLHRHAGGIPRLINVIAERSLLAGYAEDRRQLDRRIVDSAAAEVLARDRHRRRNRYGWPLAVAAGALSLAAAIGLGAWLKPEPAAEATIAADAGTSAPVDLEAVLADSSEGQAAQALLAAWSAPPNLAARVLECPFRLDPGLYCVRNRGTLAQLASLDRPALLVLPDGGRRQLLSLSALDNERASVSGTATAPTVVARALLEVRWPGEYLAVFRLPDRVPAVAPGRLPDWGLAALDEFESNRTLPALSEQSERLRRLQQAHGLSADGVTGPETWWLLSAHLEGGPRLRRDRPGTGTR